MTMTTSITPGQQKQLRRLVEDAAQSGVDLLLQQVELDKERLQNLFANGDELKAAVRTTIIQTSRALSLPNQFANEEVESTYGYLSGYKAPRPIAEQLAILRQYFPELGTCDESIATRDLPSGAEGYFAIPLWQKIAPTYGEAVQKVLDLIKTSRNGKFYNYREGRLGPKQLRLHARTTAKFEHLAEQQSGQDFLVLAAQFGLRHRGRSVRRAREVLITNEFGLDPFSVGIMILTHPERLQQLDDLWIDCAGAEFSPDAGGDFSKAPFFSFGVGRVEFGTNDVGFPGGSYGSASGFGSQS